MAARRASVHQPELVAGGTAGADSAALLILDPDQTDLRNELDRVFTGWGIDDGAREISPPPLYPVADLARLDVYRNFPHLSLVAARLDVIDEVDAPAEGRFAPAGLEPARFGLPMATCYGAFLFHAGTTIPSDTLVTLVNHCFRGESRFEGLRRLLSFQMREIVAIGSFEHTQRLLSRFTARITAFAEALSLPLEKVPASDPFFEQDGSRALLQKLSPVKYEFVCGDLAIASVNTHRNFFGERCGISLGDGSTAFTGCVAFGLERWLAVLTDLAGDPVSALRGVRAAANQIR
ncbi:hypothetical protein BS329_39385 [Amycolatopsis coloradensis]|uniref:Aminoacyl-transfer RNA synthetases class-II family profile domain-containing protein n=1 Tax=Amycolatopsis coloradensis TaxID=76021 RepID=A0A1R0KEG7_9PSEU|nr:hypothetical protein [Amycolatopsis coloradensis]OLZ43390.1 hypothetical protein BS329_39385 [Amycolatopsis coloradensis]